MKTGIQIFHVILTCLTLVVCGCQEIEDDRSGRIAVRVTDAPFPIDLIDEATVSITRVDIRNKLDAEGKKIITLFEDTVEFNLLELRNGVTADLLEAEIPSGDYDLIRLFVDKATLSVKDQDTYHVKVPSGATTGIRLFFKPDLRIAGGLTEVLLDFNLERSFVLKGDLNTPAGIKGFSFKPVIRAVNNATSGMVEGVVTDVDSAPQQHAAVWIEQDSVISTAYSDEQGYYALSGIPAGIFSVSAVKEPFDTVTFEQIEVIEGNLTKLNFLLEPIAE